MADWYGTARSNYFKVRSESEFLKWAETVECEACQKNGRWAIVSTSANGGFASSRFDDGGEYVDFSIMEEIVPHLAEGAVAIFIEVGAEKSRYLTGEATAVSWTGEMVHVSLDDIYGLACEAFGVDPTTAEF